MTKTILFFWLCFLVGYPAVAKLSDGEKREFIESLAEPLKVKKVFYRWQEEEERKKIIDAGEMTPEIYDNFRSHHLNSFEGVGIYVSENITSLATDDDITLIQVEAEPGYKFLNLSDKEVQKQLRKKGISLEEVYRLNPRVALKAYGMDWWTSSVRNVDSLFWNFKPWWILKAGEGIKFKPFSSDGMSLDDLEEIYEKLPPKAKAFFKDSIREDVVNRAEESADVFKSPFVEIVAEVRGEEYVMNKLSHYSSEVKTFKDSVKWLRNAGKYFSDSDYERIVQKAKTFPIFVFEEGKEFLDLAEEYLSEADTTEVKEQIPPNSADDAMWLLSDPNLSQSSRRRIMEIALLYVESEEGLAQFKEVLSDLEYEEFVKQFKANTKHYLGKISGRVLESLRCLQVWLSKQP